MIVLVVLATLLVGVALHDLVRRPVLRRVALRNLTRRRGEASLVVLGSALGTAIIAGAFVVGDTFDNSIRDIARTDLGPIDQVVDVTDVDRLDATIAAIEGSTPIEGVDGVAGVVRTQAALATTGPAPLAEPSVSIVEGDFDELRALGETSSGLVAAGTTPTVGELVLVDDVADELELDEGDDVVLHAYGVETPLTVRTIVPHVGIAGQGEAFIAPGTLTELAARGPPEGTPPAGEVWVSLVGDVFDADEFVDPASAAIDERLDAAGLAFEQSSAKQSLLDEAQEEGDELTSIFTAIGGFSVLAGVLLLVNLFVMLAEERKVSLGVLRAVGWRRGHLVRGFVLEGAAYAAIAAAVGAAMGIGVGWVLIRVTSAIFASTGTDLTLQLAIEPASLLTAALAGLVISLVVIWLTSWRISRLGIIRALRDLPEPTSQRGALVVSSLGALGIAAGLALTFGPGAGGSAELLLVGVPIALFSLLVVLNRFVSTRWANIGIGLAVIGWSVAAFGLYSDVLNDPPISAFLLQGVLMVTGAVAIASTMGPAWARLASRFGADDPATKLGLAYPVARRFRTGVSLAMFSLIVFSLTFMAVLNRSFGDQTDAFVADASGGFDAVVDSNPADPLGIADLDADSSVTDTVEVSWGIVPFSTDLVPETLDDPERWSVTGIDDSFTSLGGAPVLIDRADRYDSDVAAFDGLAAADDEVIISQWFLEEDAQVRNPAAGDTVGLVLEDGTVQSLTVVGIVENDIPFAGAYVSRDLVDRGLAETTWPRHYVTFDGDVDAAATALDGRFVENGTEVSTFASIVRDEVRLQQGFFDLLSGYLALGLVIGVAGLGVVMVRAVRERRAQVGMLRSMGLPAGGVGRWFVTEAGFVALQGIGAGVLLGLASSYQLLTRTSTFEIDLDFAVPVTALSVIVLVPLVAAGLAAAVPAVRAARLRPSEALRLTS
ncbi:MAG: FtsX-like permease family protein [Actinomycetota bacterium]